MSFFDFQQIIISGKIQVRELRYTTNDVAILNISIPTKYSWKKKDSEEWEEETTWHNITVFNPNDYIIKQCQKGMPVTIVGRIQKSTYEKDGQTHYNLNVIADRNGVKILDPIKENGSSENYEDDGYNHFENKQSKDQAEDF